jgi:hypothetical protein
LATTYEDNILNDYDNYTYNWKIKMVHPSRTTQGGIVIAESGVDNEISIEQVSHEYKLAFSETNRSSTSNYFTISFKEPNGFSLFTRIKVAAISLGIENHLEAAYVLTLKCIGHQDGNIVNPIPNTDFEWVTKMFGISHDFDGTSSNYTAALIEQKDTIYETQDYLFPEDISVSARNLGEFASELANRLNEKSREMTNINVNKILPTIYQINFPSEWNGFEFAAVLADSSSGGGRMVSNDGDRLKFDFPTNMQINEMMGIAFLHTEEGRRIPDSQGGFLFPEASGENRASAERLAQLPLWYSFNQEVEYGDFDRLSGQYQRTLTFNMIPYITPELIADRQSHSQLRNQGLQNLRLQRIINENLLKKKYDYYYTGLNTEVLNLDIQFNNAYYMLSPLVVGNTEETRNQGTPSETDRLSQITSQISNLQTQINEITQNFENVPSEIGRNLRTLTDLRNQLGRLTEEALTINAGLGNSIPSPQSLDTDRYMTQRDLTGFDPGDDLKFNYQPFQSLSTDGPDNGIEGDPGAVRLGVVEFSLNSLRDMLNIVLTVRGDPYWLGQRDVFDKGGPSFFLNINLPYYDENTDDTTAQPRPDFAITGLYRVFIISSTFSGGQWIMNLTAYRDLATNVSRIYSDLQEGTLRSQGFLNSLANAGRNAPPIINLDSGGPQ